MSASTDPLELQVLSPETLTATALRILAAPRRQSQRVSMNEVYTFALFTVQAVECLATTARLLEQTAAAAERLALRRELETLGLLLPEQSSEPHP